MIKHLTPRNETEVAEFFSTLSNKDLFNIGVFDEYAQNVLNERLGCKAITLINAQYLWHGSENIYKSYVKVEYTMTFIIEHSNIPFFESEMRKDFGNLVIINYDHETQELIVTFIS